MTSTFDPKSATPEVQQAYLAYQMGESVLNAQPDGPEKERRRDKLLDAFKEVITANASGGGEPADAPMTMMKTKDRRTPHPGLVNLETNRRKEELFDEAYAKPGYSKALIEEFFQKAQVGQVDPQLVFVMGMTLCVEGKHAKDDMEKRLCRLLAIWLREPAATQVERYNFFKLSELDEEIQLSVALGIPSLTQPLFPFHHLTQAKNSEMIHRAINVMGGGVDDEAEDRFRSFYKYPAKTFRGSGYSVPVHSFDGQQVSTADLSDVEAQFYNLQQQVQALGEKQVRELSKTVSRRITQYDQRKRASTTRTTAANTCQNRRGTEKRVYKGGASGVDQNDVLDEFFEIPTPSASNR